MSDIDEYYAPHGTRTVMDNAELHIYVVPAQLWPDRQRFSAQRVTRDFASAGFIRVNGEISLEEARREIAFHFGSAGNLPADFQFVRDVDRRLVQVTGKQERQLKVRHFLPPYSESAALFVVDKRVVDDYERNFISGNQKVGRAFATRPSSYSQAMQNDEQRGRPQFRKKASSVQLPKIDVKSRPSVPSYMQVRDLDLRARDYISRQALRNRSIDQRMSRQQDSTSVQSFDDTSPRAMQLIKHTNGDRRFSELTNHAHSLSMNALDGPRAHFNASRIQNAFSPTRTEFPEAINNPTFRKPSRSYFTPAGSRKNQYDYFYFLTGAQTAAQTGYVSGAETPASTSNRSTPPEQDTNNVHLLNELVIQPSPSPRNSEIDRLERERLELDELERRERERIAREEADRKVREAEQRRKLDLERTQQSEERKRLEEEMSRREKEFKAQLEQELAARRAEIERLQNFKGDLQSNLEDLYESKQSKDAEVQQQLELLRKKKEEAESRLQQEKSMKMNEMESAIQLLNQEIVDLQQNVEIQRSSNDKEQREMLERRRQLEEELKKAEESAQNGLAQLQVEMKNAMQKLEDEKKQREREFEDNKLKHQQEFEAIQKQLAQIELQRTQLEQEYASRQQEAQQRLTEEYEMRQKEWQNELERMQQENSNFQSLDEERKRRLEDELRKFEQDKARLLDDEAAKQQEAQQRLLKLLEDNERKRHDAEEELRQRQKAEELDFQEQLKRFEDEKVAWQEQIERRKAEEEKRRTELEKQFKEEEERRQREHEQQLKEIKDRMSTVRSQYQDSQKRFTEELKQYKEQEEQLRQDTAEAIRLAQQSRRLPANLNLPDLVDSRGDPNALAKEKQRLIEERQKVRERRIEAERKREALVKEAKQLQKQAQGRRNQVRDNWKKRYFDEKRKTPVLEEQLERLKGEFEQIHQKLLGHLSSHSQSSAQNSFFNSLILTGDNRPSESNNLRIQAARLKHEIATLQRDVDNTRLRVAAEARLRMQAEAELRAMRAESVHRRTTTSVLRNGNSSLDGVVSSFNTPRFLNEHSVKPSPRAAAAAANGSPDLGQFRLNFPQAPPLLNDDRANQPPTQPEKAAADSVVTGERNSSLAARRNQIFEDIRETEREHDESNKATFESPEFDGLKQFNEPNFQIAERA